MSIHYKFKSALEYDTITFDGLHISVKDLKNSILQQKRIGKNSDFDLQVTNAQTKEVYSDEDALIPKNTSLLIARVPLSVPNKGKSWEGYGAGDTGASARLDDGGPIGKAADLSSLDASEDEKIRAMISQSTQEYDPSNYLKVRGANQVGPVPQNYKCYKCHLGGHWIKDCPLGLSADSVEIKKSTGIPKSFMRQVAGPDVAGAMITPNGSYAVHCNTVDDSAPISSAHGTDGGGNNIPPLGPTFTTRADIPEDLLCSICDDLLVDAVMIPCCGNSFCDECVRNSLLESEEHECPDCHERDIAPTTLIPNRFLRKSVSTFKNESGYVKKYREPRVVLPKKVEEQRPAPADSSTINNIPSENSGKTIISEADSTESAKLAAINDVPKPELKEEPEKPQPVTEEPPPVNPSVIPVQEKLPKDVRPITNVATTYRDNRQHARDRERNDNANARYRVPTGLYQRGDRSPVGASQRSKYRRSPPRGGLVREERSDTPTIDEPGMTGLGPAPDPQRDYAPPPGTFMNPEPRPQGPPLQQLPPVMQQLPPPGPMQMIVQMQLPPPGMSVPPPGPYGGMPHQLGVPGVFAPGMPPNFRHPPPGAPPPIQTYMPGPYNVPPRPIFDGSRGPPPLVQPPIGVGYPPHFAPRGRPCLPPRGIRVHTPPNVIDDPLEAFNRILREKDERRRRAQAQRRSYSRSRSSSRSYSRSPNRRGGGGSRSPRRRGSRSRSRSVRSGRSPMGRERSPRSFTISRSRSRSRSLSPFGGGARDRDRERDYSPPPYHYQHQPHHHHHHGGRDHYPPHHHNSPPPYNKYGGGGGPPSGHYTGARGTGRRGGSRYRSPPVQSMVGRNVSPPPPPSRGYNNRGGGGFKDFKDNVMDNRERHYDHYPPSRDRDQRVDRDVSNKPTMAELALGRADRYRNIDRDRDRDYGPPLSVAAAATMSPSTRDLRDNMRGSDRDQAPMQRRSSRSPTGRRFSPSSRHATVRSQPSPHHQHQQQQQSDKRGRSKDRDRADNTRQDNRNDRDGGNKDRDRSRIMAANDAPSGGGGGVVASFYPPPAVVMQSGATGVSIDGAVDYNRFGARQQVGQPTSHYPIAMDIVAPPGTTEQPLPPGEELPPQQQQQQQQYQLPIDPVIQYEQQQSGFIHMQHNQQSFIPQNVIVGTTGHHNRDKQFSLNEDNSKRRSRYAASDRNDRGENSRDKSRTSSKDNYDSPDRRSNVKTSRRLGSSPPVKTPRKEREYSDDDRRNRKADKKKKKDKKEQDKKKKKDKREGDKKDKKKNKEKPDLSDKEDNKKKEVTNDEKIVENVEKSVVVEMEPPKESVSEVVETKEIITAQEVEPINDLYGDLINEEIVDSNIVQSYGKLQETAPEVPQTKLDHLQEETTAALTKNKSPERSNTKIDVVPIQAESAPEVVEQEIEDPKELEMDVLELHSQDDVEEDKELLHLLPEKSKWETEAIEDNGVVDVKQEDANKAATKVSNEVLKRAENAIFAKAINAIRPPIEIKKISLDRAKLYSTKVEVDDFPRNVQVTLKNDHYEEPTDSTTITQESVVDLSIQEQKPPPQPRLSVKERLGCKVDDLDRIIRIDIGRNRSKSKSASPLRKKYVDVVQTRRFDAGRREEKLRYNSRDKDRIARSYRNAERSRSKDKKEDCRKKIQENRSRKPAPPDKPSDNSRKKRRSRSRSRGDKKKDSKRVRKDKDKEKSTTSKGKEDNVTKKSANQSKSSEVRKKQQQQLEEKRQRSAEPAPPGTEDSSPPQPPPPILPPPPPPPPPSQRKVAIIEEKQRKSTIDEASFEPDYDLESDEDKSKRSTTPQPIIRQQKNVKIIKASNKEDPESSSDSSSSSGRKKKKQHKKKSKKRRRRDSSSNSSSDSSSDSEEKKRKKHKKKSKKSKKRKHKDR